MRKLMWFTAGFATACLLTGYLISYEYYLPAVVVCCLFLAISLLVMLKFQKVRLPAVVLFGMLAALCWQFVFDSFYLSAVRAGDGGQITCDAVILEDFTQTNFGCSTEVLFSLEGTAYKGTLYLTEMPDAGLGDTVSGTFLLKSCLPGGTAENSYSCGNRLYLILAAVDTVTVWETERMPWYCRPAQLRQQLTTLMGSIFPADTLAFARALLLGDTELIDYETDTDLKLSGIRHVIAVSGLHVTLLVALLSFIFGRRRWLIAAVVLPSLLLCAAVVGFSPSITRACIMHGLMVLALLFEKEYDGPTALSFSLLVMLSANPMAALNVSLQMSVGCMIGIFLCSEPIRSWLLDKKRLGRYKCRRLCSWFAGSVSVSIGASLVTTPLSAMYFGTVSLVGILTNLLTLWCITCIFYGLIAACLLALVWQPLGAAAAWLISWGIRGVLAVSGLLAAFPLAAVYTESIYIVLWLLFCYVLLAVYWLLHRKKPMVYGCCAACGLFLALLLSWMEPLTDGCRMTALDVGQGQCILLQSEGKNYLVDCGGDSDQLAADKAANYLLSQGISHLDGIFVTHFDRDHAGGVQLLLTRISADALYLPEPVENDSLSHALYGVNTPICPVDSLQELGFANTKITIIPSEIGTVDNESGLCILFQRENCDILITGDRSAFGERELMRAVSLPDLEVLVVGHHGSAHSTCEELLARCTPEIAVISVGAENSYGHPAQEVLDRLSAYGCTYYRTDLSGTVIYRG